MKAASPNVRGRLTQEYVALTTTFVGRRLAGRPFAAIILGTGLDAVAGELHSGTSMPYGDIPGFPTPTVSGHAGTLTSGLLGRVPVLAFRGRFHLYEGFPPSVLGLPVRLACALGCRVVVVTNAAGGLRSDLAGGDLMVIRDHIGLPGLAGSHPLVGWPVRSDSERFVGMADAYDVELRDTAFEAANRNGIPLHQGTYVMVAGPTYETPAECRLLGALGADAVGMSTVAEVQVARQLGMRVLGISCITNAAATTAEEGHEDVVAVAQRTAARVAVVVRGALEAVYST